VLERTAAVRSLVFLAQPRLALSVGIGWLQARKGRMGARPGLEVHRRAQPGCYSELQGG